MLKRQMILGFAVVSLLVYLVPVASVRADLGSRAESYAQKSDKDAKAQKSDKKDKHKQDKKSADHEDKPAKLAKDEGRDVHNSIWEEPADIATRDLYYGPGGQEGSPETATKFTFVSRDPKGTSDKIVVNDDKGRQRSVTFGPEARPETRAPR